MASSNDLDIVNVTKRFGAHVAVNDVTFSVAPGEFFSILGPSGCGKTTLMRMIAGFENPTSGDIRIRGRVDDRRSGQPPSGQHGFQSLALFPMMSVGENVAYGMTCRGVSRAEADERATRMLERVGLKGFGDRQVTALSGGQRQRVAIARCLVLEPTLVLLDEPLGALDLKLREHMKIELKQLQGTFNTTFAYITHDQSEALVMSDRIAVMNQGRFEQVGNPRELYHSPATPFVASFVGETNRWQGAGRMVPMAPSPCDFPLGSSCRGEGSRSAARRSLSSVRRPWRWRRIRSSALPACQTASTAAFRRCCSTVPSPACSSKQSASTSRFAPCCRRPEPLAGINVGAPIHLGWTSDAMKVFAA